MDGILLVDKPEGLTSAAVVRIAKRSLRVKVGHLGTLDPFATGLLPLCLGEGTKIAQFLVVADKVYDGFIRLGSETDSGDRTGRVVRTAEVPVFEPAALEVLAQRFTGEQLQTPPMFSAIKQGGVPLYELARAGTEVERAPRPVVIHRLQLRLVAPDLLALAVHCSKGTYIRVLAQDLGVALGSAAHLEALRRTAFGAFSLGDAVSLADLEAGRVDKLIGLRAALRHLREFSIDVGQAHRARSGQAAALRDLPAAAAVETAKLIGPGGELIAVVSGAAAAPWRFERVFAHQQV
ncbi:MAG: tRNA pseudouridine(55) synthase TruB [Deltaproteobacteria bacterium]|nr:tRNA pseudouridine(55) synthase TruB [Deltaproteobacteria bacterium]